MTSCKQAEKWMAERLSDEPDLRNQEMLERHLKECAECRDQYERIENTLKTMSQYERPELDEAYWTAYWNKLESRLPDRRPSRVPALTRLFSGWFQPETQLAHSPRLALGAAVILIVGIFIGRTFLSAPGHPSGQTALSQGAIPAELLHQTTQYIERSKLILLGIVNSEHDSDDLFDDNFTRQRHISRQLVNQTGALKNNLEANRQHMLAELVSELEVILMQIANLEAENDLDGVELIRSGAETSKILFKINVGELLLSDPKPLTSSRKPMETI